MNECSHCLGGPLTQATAHISLACLSGCRFFNHRCEDATLIDVPVEIEGPRHNYYHIAFFTNCFVRARTELTWDYGQYRRHLLSCARTHPTFHTMDSHFQRVNCGRHNLELTMDLECCFAATSEGESPWRTCARIVSVSGFRLPSLTVFLILQAWTSLTRSIPSRPLSAAAGAPIAGDSRRPCSQVRRHPMCTRC